MLTRSRPAFPRPQHSPFTILSARVFIAQISSSRTRPNSPCDSFCRHRSRRNRIRRWSCGRLISSLGSATCCVSRERATLPTTFHLPHPSTPSYIRACTSAHCSRLRDNYPVRRSSRRGYLCNTPVLPDTWNTPKWVRHLARLIATYTPRPRHAHHDQTVLICCYLATASSTSLLTRVHPSARIVPSQTLYTPQWLSVYPKPPLKGTSPSINARK